MIDLSKTATAALSAAVLGLAVVACQPQGEAPTAEPDMPMDEAVAEAEPAPEPEAEAAPEPASGVLSPAQITELLVGNTVFAEYEPWKLRWAEYFAPDGTTKAWTKFEGQEDGRITGKHYVNSEGHFCTEYPELPDQNVFCHTIVDRGDGSYQQLNTDGSLGGVYTQVLPGDQVDTHE